MGKQLNELVQRLTVEQEIECSRPQKSTKSLQECINRNYVHVMFKNTGTELGMELIRQFCNFSNCDFNQAKGEVTLAGVFILNYDKVKCIARVDIATCEGTGFLQSLSDSEYAELAGKAVPY